MTTKEQLYDVFISHSQKDKDLAEEIAASLNRLGISVFDDSAIGSDADWTSELANGLDSAKAVIILVGDDPYSDSMLSQEWSQIVEASWKQPRRPIIPLVRGDAKLPPFLQKIQAIYVDESNVQETAENLVSALRSDVELGKSVNPQGFLRRVQANEQLIQKAIGAKNKEIE